MNIPNTDKKKVLMLVSYSANNADTTYRLTYDNHIRYCRKNGYSYMAVNEPYSMYVDLARVKRLLQEFDIVFTCDSDIIITDQSKRIEEYAHNYLNICVEQWCREQLSFFNGGFLIFCRKDAGIFEWLDRLQAYTDECRKIQKTEDVYLFTVDRSSTNFAITKYAEYGTQSVLNLAFISHNEEIMEGMYMIASGSLQSYLPEYLHYQIGGIYDFALWNKEKFAIHLIGLKPNGRFKTKAELIQDFLDRHPEYK